MEGELARTTIVGDEPSCSGALDTVRAPQQGQQGHQHHARAYGILATHCIPEHFIHTDWSLKHDSLIPAEPRLFGLKVFRGGSCVPSRNIL
ncbi:hypothetical protein AOLI_G00307200 [Acnodon oligacanthus]